MSKFETFTGEVVAKARNGKGLAFNVDGDDTWFNAMKESQIPGDVKKGDVVSFEYDETVKGGKTFRNIKGDVEAEASNSSSRSSSARSGGGSRGGGSSYSKGSGGSTGGGGPDRRDVQIVRQNSLTQANALYATLSKGTDPVALEQAPAEAEFLVELARIFEAYSLGKED